ncbi:hypothetical protein PABG_00130 [Paracoccidioides brasiliensis Pb03]|nr:hypothetical protein PABG_00130 [Paracoccidioides brasiliensis Pb03]
MPHGNGNSSCKNAVQPPGSTCSYPDPKSPAPPPLQEIARKPIATSESFRFVPFHSGAGAVVNRVLQHREGNPTDCLGDLASFLF